MNGLMSEPRQRKYGQLAFVFLLLVLGGACFVIGIVRDNGTIRTLGVLLTLASVSCVRMFQMRARAGTTILATQRTRARGAERFGGPIGILGILLVPMLGLSYAGLWLDAAYGYNQLWPLYLFGGIGIVCMLCWPYLLARWFYRRSKPKA